MADVHLPRSLVALFPGAPRRVEARGATVAEVIADLDAQVPGIRNRLLDAGPDASGRTSTSSSTGERATLSTPVPDGRGRPRHPGRVRRLTIRRAPAEEGPMEERFVPGAGCRGSTDRARPTPTPTTVRPRAAIDDPRALQILSTEHWSLLTARSLVYNETFARGGMFLAFLSATLLVLGLISTATGFSDAFLIVAALILGAGPVRRPRDARPDRRGDRRGPPLPPGHEPAAPRLPRDGPGPGAVLHHQPLRRLRLRRRVLRTVGTVGPCRGLIHGFTTMPGMIAVICCAGRRRCSSRSWSCSPRMTRCSPASSA